MFGWDVKPYTNWCFRYIFCTLQVILHFGHYLLLISTYINVKVEQFGKQTSPKCGKLWKTHPQILYRPCLWYCQVSQWYDLVVFTASMEIYGAAVAEKLDRNRGILKRRYYRQVSQYIRRFLECS